ncbi:alpha/beta hydrolase [Diaphorobacter limosus]|uniref:Alpha/beta hydrolase n=1 Tax=Diaphorobacter limosus TaxID=3036128 RepID=A0ABZ0J0P0_9BURK|nr:alpha/beta hydrolase [Diaphorobacter sp. Y-1]WOO31603.1 alpha/beta hydrolase [Diaphorobacter sp. Y-1]
MNQWLGLTMVSAAAMLAACGGGSDLGGSTETDLSGARGSLMHNPPLRVTALSAGEFKDRLAASPSGQSLLALAGAPKCGVDVHYIEYGTVGGAGEKTNASGALMVPTGGVAGCGGARPVVLYAHGTTTDRAYNIADITEPARPGASEGSLLAAMYAAQGFIVVAPNYAGYDVSKLGYHPYLNADQQSKDMLDALAAARKALPRIGSQDGGKLLVAGYSQGGHVAMATHRALQAAGQPVTASAPMSGPYALGAFGDAVYYGNVNLGATVFTPLLAASYQKAYGNLYAQPSDMFEAAYATGIEQLLPSATPLATLVAQGKLPQTQLFSSTPPAPAFAAITPPTQPPALAPLFALGFGSNNLVKNSARLAYLQDAAANPDGAVPNATTGAQAAAPQHPLRKAFKANDLRNWKPQRPVLLCGGNADPTVFYGANTALMQNLWSNPASPLALPAGLLTVLDVDSASAGAADPFAAVKAGFAQAKAGAAAQGGANAVVQAYHGSLVPPFCNVAARAFFQQVLASGG